MNRATAETVAAGPDSLVITLENTSDLYLQTVTENPLTCNSVAAQPGLVDPGRGSLCVWIHVEATKDQAAQDIDFSLPHDLPPLGKLTVVLPADRFAGAGDRLRCTVTPNFGLLGLWTDPTSALDVRLSLTEEPSSPLAGAGGTPALKR